MVQAVTSEDPAPGCASSRIPGGGSHSPAGRESFQVCGGGGLGDGKLRRDAVVRLDLDEGQLARAALAEGGGGAVSGEHVGVAVTAKARIGRVRVVPGAGGKLGDT